MPSDAVYQLSPNLLVRQSSLYQTNSGIVLAGGRAVLVDPGIFRVDLDELNRLRQPRLVAFGLITHAHWDHLLWSPAFDPAPRYCSVGTDAQMTLDEQALRAQLSQEEAKFGGTISQWDKARFFDRQGLTPGVYDLEGFHFEVVELPGHCPGQAGFIFEDQEAIFVGDTLSDVEVPTISDRASIPAYLAALDTLEARLTHLQWVIPGHGTPATAVEALNRLALDRAYLTRLSGFVGFANGTDRQAEARFFLDQLGETRADLEPAWSMHLENLTLLSAG